MYSIYGVPYLYFDNTRFLASDYSVPLQKGNYIAVAGYGGQGDTSSLISGIFGGTVEGVTLFSRTSIIADGSGAGSESSSAFLSLNRYHAIFQAVYDNETTTNNSIVFINNRSDDFDGIGVTRNVGDRKLTIGNRGTSVGDART
jgi:hypothetical protein